MECERAALLLLRFSVYVHTKSAHAGVFFIFLSYCECACVYVHVCGCVSVCVSVWAVRWSLLRHYLHRVVRQNLRPKEEEEEKRSRSPRQSVLVFSLFAAFGPKCCNSQHVKSPSPLRARGGGIVFVQPQDGEAAYSVEKA